MFKEAWNLAIQAQNCQHAVAGTPVGIASGCYLPRCPSLNIDPQTFDAI